MFQNTITIKLPLQISNTKNREYNYDTNMGQAQKCDGVILVNDIPPSSLDNYIQMYTNRYKPQKSLHRLISNQQKIPYCNIKSTT
jgi:hypothetical protein